MRTIQDIKELYIVSGGTCDDSCNDCTKDCCDDEIDCCDWVFIDASSFIPLPDYSNNFQF